MRMGGRWDGPRPIAAQTTAGRMPSPDHIRLQASRRSGGDRTASAYILRRRNLSVLRRMVDAIDDQELDRAFLDFDLQAQLLLERRAERGYGLRSRVIGPRTERSHPGRGVSELDIESAGQSGAVDHRRRQLTRYLTDQHLKRPGPKGHRH